MVIDLQTTITDITVFRTRASLVRKGTIDLEAGEHTLSITKLPRLIEETKVQVSVQPPEVRILGVEVITRSEDIDPIEETPPISESELERRLEAALQTDQKLEDRLKLLGSRQAVLETLLRSTCVNLGTTIAEGKAEPERLKGVIDFVERELTALAQERRDLTRNRGLLKQFIEAIQEALKTPPHKSKARQRQWREARVVVEVPEATEVTLTITYLALGAGWEPGYELRLYENKLALTYQAILRQNTDEEWPLLPLTLSTAASHQTPNLSLPRPWRLDRLSDEAHREYEREKAALAMGKSPSGMMTTVISKRTQESIRAAHEDQQPEPAAAGPITTYRTVHPLTIPNNGSGIKTELAVIDLEAPLDYASVPKVASQVVLRSKIQNTSPFTLIPGSAILFQGDTYVGQTQIGMVAPGEQFVLILGVEDRIRIQRTRTEHKVITLTEPPVGRITHTYQISVSNYLEKAASVTVRDQIPTSVHGDIRVTLSQVTPEPAPHQGGEVDMLKWQLDIPSQGTQVIAFTFEVEYPRDAEITGIL